MQETDILDIARRILSNQGIATSAGLDRDGNIHCIGIGNGKYVSRKVNGPEKEAPQDMIIRAGELLAQSIASEMAGQ